MIRLHIFVVLFNSFLHHFSDEDVLSMMSPVPFLLNPEGVCIILEPLIPPRNEIFPRIFMALDRGKFFRHKEDWIDLFQRSGLKVEKELYHFFKLFGVPGSHAIAASLKPTAD